MFSFVNVWLALGAVGGAIPIIIHLLNRRRFRVVRWAAMEFLLASLKKNYRRVRFENLLLLLLRVLIIVLMALALARPRVSESGLIGALGTETRHVIIVLDHSLSMRYRDGRETSFDKAKAVAHRILETMSHGDVVSLLTMSDITEPIVREASLDIELIKHELERLQPGWGGTDIRRALVSVSELLRSPPTPRKDIFILTDMQAGAWGRPDEAPGAELNAALDRIRKEAKVFVVDVGAAEPANLAVTRIEPRFRIVGTGSPTEFDVDVTNFGGAKRPGVPVSFLVDKFRQNVENLDVGPGETVTATFTHSFQKSGPHIVQAELGDDRLNADNVRHLALNVEEFVPVLLVDGETSSEIEENETYYLERALSPPTAEGAPRPSNIKPTTINEFGLSAMDFTKHRLVALANLASLSVTDALPRLEDYVKHGGALIIFLGDRVDRRFYNAHLFKAGHGLLPASLGEETGSIGEDRKGITLELAKPVHPAFGRFTGESGFFLKGLLFYKYFDLTLPEKRDDIRVLANFDGGKPAIIEKAFGSGKVLLFASSADAEWNSFPVSAAYPVIINDLVNELVMSDADRRNLLVHEPYRRTFAPEELVDTALIRSPSEAAAEKLKPYPVRRAVESGDPAAGETAPSVVTEIVFRKTGAAGLYELELERKEGDKPPIEYFAVNTAPEESDLRRANPDEVRKLLKGFEFTYATGVPELQLAVRESRQGRELSRSFLLAVLIVACIELVLAQRFGR